MDFLKLISKKNLQFFSSIVWLQFFFIPYPHTHTHMEDPITLYATNATFHNAFKCLLSFTIYAIIHNSNGFPYGTSSKCLHHLTPIQKCWSGISLQQMCDKLKTIQKPWECSIILEIST